MTGDGIVRPGAVFLARRRFFFGHPIVRFTDAMTALYAKACFPSPVTRGLLRLYCDRRHDIFLNCCWSSATLLPPMA
jgi:hypothetical protein